MGKYAGIVVGAIVLVIGIIGLLRYWQYFTGLLKGSIPAMLIFAGAVAVIAGISEMKGASLPKKEEAK